MAVLNVLVDRGPADVWDVLADGSAYGEWVRGAQQTCDVDPRWPEVGSALRYTAGFGPLRYQDVTTVRLVEPGRHLELEAHAGRLGTARISIELLPWGDDRPVVTLRPEGGQATLRITDTGIGVAAGEMPRLFERFHRIPNARSRSNEGSGIGLALVRELVGLHGGTITADSTEDAGTTFTIRLPFGHDHLPAANVAPAAGPDMVSAVADPFVEEALRWLPGGEAPLDALPPATGALLRESPGPAGPAGPGPASTARVLLADDNADMREYLQRLLRASYQVTAVADGLTALDEVRASAPDLVISDVMMPGLDGLALVAALRADPCTADVPVLLLSARAGQEAAIEGLEAGADDYLVKPFSAAELLARVRANVELARLRNHHARWRAALIDSLHEAFFLCDEAGTVVEINAAFTDMLGYGPEGLPYAAEYAWWPGEDTEPEAHRQLGEAFGQLMRQTKGSFVAPVTHKDGHRLWVAASFNEVQDPDTGRRMVVGTLRDITAEHYAGQREAALAAMGLLLSQASSVPQALQGAINELRRLWQARRALAVTWDGGREPSVMSTGAETSWADLPASRERISALRRQPLLSPADGASAGRDPGRDRRRRDRHEQLGHLPGRAHPGPRPLTAGSWSISPESSTWTAPALRFSSRTRPTSS